jgi:hypothetical protein
MGNVRQVLRIFAVAAVIAAISCSTVRVETDYDPDADFGGLSTYAWMPHPPAVSNDPLLHNSLLDSRVRSSVDKEMAAKGIRKVSAAKASFLVNYYINLEQKIRVDTIPVATYGYGYGVNRRYGGMAAETQVQQYEVGTLILDIVDPKKSELLWRGSGSTRVGRANTPEDKQKKVDEAVTKMLAEFPPSP